MNLIANKCCIIFNFFYLFMENMVGYVMISKEDNSVF